MNIIFCYGKGERERRVVLPKDDEFDYSILESGARFDLRLKKNPSTGRYTLAVRSMPENKITLHDVDPGAPTLITHKAVL